MTTAVSTAVAHRNEVVVVGRLSTVAEVKELPSGDEMVKWRLVVERPPASGRAGFDTLDCVTFRARVRQQALGWSKDDVIEVAGALRHRFWGGPAGRQSAHHVEVVSASKLTAAVKRPRKPG